MAFLFLPLLFLALQLRSDWLWSRAKKHNEWASRAEWWQAAITCAVICFIAGVGTYFGTLYDVTRLDCYPANRQVMAQAIEDARNAIYDLPSTGDADIGIRVENMQQSRSVTEMINTLAQWDISYNRDMAYYRLIPRWTVWPFVNFPKEIE